MSAYYSETKSEFICVDELASWRQDKKTGSSASRWFLTETECGSLSCPPYIANREVVCVVCSPLTRSGSVYTRWGRKSCPSSSELVYTGQTAAALHSHSGSGANTVCLVDGAKASYLNYNDANNEGALLYGVTYQTSGYGLGTLNSLHNQLVPCSVCFASDRFSSFMLPGNTSCPRGWDKEYSGYLFSAHYSHKKVNWLCVDESPESNGAGSGGQGIVYPVEIECGSIKCGSSAGDYVSNRELTCAVCNSPLDRKSALFTRRGRSDCPVGVILVYSGFAAGSSRGHSGSGSATLCMPNMVDYVDFSDSDQNGGLLYGFEYETSGYGLSSTTYQSVNNMEVWVYSSCFRHIFFLM